MSMAEKYYRMMTELMEKMTSIKDRFIETSDLALVDEYNILSKTFDVLSNRYLECKD